MRNILYAFVAVLMVSAACSCRTSKNTEQQVNRDYTEDLGRISRQVDSLRAGFQVTREQVTDKLSNLKVENTTTYYTLPDSAGKQYPVYVSTTKADRNEESTERIYAEMNATIQRLSEKVDSLSRKVDAALKKEQKVAELSWWDLHKGKVFGALAVLVLGLAGWLAWRRWKK